MKIVFLGDETDPDNEQCVLEIFVLHYIKNMLFYNIKKHIQQTKINRLEIYGNVLCK